MNDTFGALVDYLYTEFEAMYPNDEDVSGYVADALAELANSGALRLKSL